MLERSRQEHPRADQERTAGRDAECVLVAVERIAAADRLPRRLAEHVERLQEHLQSQLAPVQTQPRFDRNLARARDRGSELARTDAGRERERRTGRRRVAETGEGADEPAGATV